MQFDPHNKIIQLCTQGMEMEARLKPIEAKALFLQAWEESETDFEKFTAAHYVARQQSTIKEKLEWDKTALDLALKIDDKSIQASYPSLHLNIAKCYEDLQDIENARDYYQLALSFTGFLEDNGYGKMIKAGIENGIKRVSEL